MTKTENLFTLKKLYHKTVGMCLMTGTMTREHFLTIGNKLVILTKIVITLTICYFMLLLCLINYSVKKEELNINEINQSSEHKMYNENDKSISSNTINIAKKSQSSSKTQTVKAYSISGNPIRVNFGESVEEKRIQT